MPPNLILERLQTVELQQFELPHDMQHNTDQIVSMLQCGCDIVRTAHLGKLQEISFRFTKEGSLDLHAWDTDSAILKEVASLEKVVVSTPSKPKITIKIPNLKAWHAESIFKTACMLFPRVDQEGNLFMSPTRESLCLLS